jgi:deoxyribodipyrimidine photolyase-related protein
MSHATIVYPHQLCHLSPALDRTRPVYLVEESLILTNNPIHRQKLIFHKLTLDAFEQTLTTAGYHVTRLTIFEHPTTESVFTRLRSDSVRTLHIADTTDDYLERAIAESGLTRVWYESPLFFLSREDARARFLKSGRFMARFYQAIRRDYSILLNGDGTPTGGQWSFDTENRHRLPIGTAVPADPILISTPEVRAAITWAATVPAEQYGEAGCWVPYTKAGAEEFLAEFFCARFTNFGAYEDAMATDHVRLFHSMLSPLMNVGLITPLAVLNAALAYANTHEVPLNSLEGFVRQVVGWREFVRASYETDGREMRTKNFFHHTQPLPASLWNGTTGIFPVDTVVGRALRFGYTHHIERLMVMGNFMLLCQIHPTEVYRWFMGMYIDAYDWVMVPNVYGMSQYADGGSFATKPYISGANYLRKMSDFPPGEWEATWTALYWQFTATHREVFLTNHRLSMVPRTWDRMNGETKKAHRDRAMRFLETLRVS